MSNGRIRQAVVEAISAARDAGVPEALVRADVEAALSLWVVPPAYKVWTTDDFTGEACELQPTFSSPEEARTYVQVQWDEMRAEGDPGAWSPEVTWSRNGLEGQGWFRTGMASNDWRFLARYEIRES